MNSKIELLGQSDANTFIVDLGRIFGERAIVGVVPWSNTVLHFLHCGGYIAANGLESIYYQSYTFPQIGKLCDFIRSIGCEELAMRLERGLDIYYRGRSDLLSFETRDAAGLDGNHLTDEEWRELSSLEDGIIGPDSLMAKAAEPFMNYVKAHPELLDVLGWNAA